MRSNGPLGEVLDFHLPRDQKYLHVVSENVLLLVEASKYQPALDDCSDFFPALVVHLPLMMLPLTVPRATILRLAALLLGMTILQGLQEKGAMTILLHLRAGHATTDVLHLPGTFVIIRNLLVLDLESMMTIVDHRLCL